MLMWCFGVVVIVWVGFEVGVVVLGEWYRLCVFCMKLMIGFLLL